jgi:hypothetical protein
VCQVRIEAFEFSVHVGITTSVRVMISMDRKFKRLFLTISGQTLLQADLFCKTESAFKVAQHGLERP